MEEKRSKRMWWMGGTKRRQEKGVKERDGIRKERKTVQG